MKNRILKIIPYYGKLPVFWDVYIKSVEFNKDVLDVLIVTDIEIASSLPSNVVIKKMSFQDMFDRVFIKTGIKVSFPNAYKLCDLKVFYGHLFEEELTGYEFWGYGDLDLVLGNLKRYLKKEILDSYDVISFREDWLSGPFTIFRNKENINKLYMDSPEWQWVLEHNSYCHFDECGTKYQLLRDGFTPEECMAIKLPGDLYCWTTAVYMADKRGDLKLYTREYIKESLPFDEIIEYRNGKVIIGGGIERAIYHFVYHKKFSKHILPDWAGKVPEHYYITTTGLYTKEQIGYYPLIKIWREFNGFVKDSRKRLKEIYNYRIKGIGS